MKFSFSLLATLVAVGLLSAATHGALVIDGAAAAACKDVLADDNTTLTRKVACPDDCTRYYVCNKYFQTTLTCPTGKHFCVKQQECVEPCEAGCDDSLDCGPAADDVADSASVDAKDDADPVEPEAEATTKKSKLAALEAIKEKLVTAKDDVMSSGLMTLKSMKKDSPGPADAAGPMKASPNSVAEDGDAAAGGASDDADKTASLWNTFLGFFN